MRNILPEKKPNAIVIHEPNTELTLLTQLKSRLLPIHVNGLTGNKSDINLMAAHFQQNNMLDISRFYDRNTHIYDWYYQCYRQPTNTNAITPVPKSVARCLNIREQLEN